MQASNPCLVDGVFWGVLKQRRRTPMAIWLKYQTQSHQLILH